VSIHTFLIAWVIEHAIERELRRDLKAHVGVKRRMYLTVSLVVFLIGGTAMAQTPAAPSAKEPVAEIVRLFGQYRLVMLGEIHGSIQFDELLKRLVDTGRRDGRIRR
jgi:hypothetical protein